MCTKQPQMSSGSPDHWLSICIFVKTREFVLKVPGGPDNPLTIGGPDSGSHSVAAGLSTATALRVEKNDRGSGTWVAIAVILNNQRIDGLAEIYLSY